MEKGEGLRSEGDRWEYVPTATGKVVAEARDLAGNVVKEEKTMENRIYQLTMPHI